MTRGIEMCVVDHVKTWWMGTDHGIYPWDNTLVMRKFDGGSFGWVVTGFSLHVISVICYLIHFCVCTSYYCFGGGT